MGIVSITTLTENQQNVNNTELNNLVVPLLNEFNGSIDNSNIKAGAAIAYSKLSLGGSILNSDISASAAIAFTKLAALTSAQILVGNGSNVATSVAVSGDITLSNDGSVTVDSVQAGAVTTSDLPDGSVVQVVNTITGAVSSGAATIPDDDSIPQNTEGIEAMTLAVTPKATTNKLKIEVTLMGSDDGASTITVALFQDTTAGALAAVGHSGTANVPETISFVHYMAAGTTSATTFKVRVGADDGGTFTFNGVSAGRIYGGIAASSITITEIAAS